MILIDTAVVLRHDLQHTRRMIIRIITRIGEQHSVDGIETGIIYGIRLHHLLL